MENFKGRQLLPGTNPIPDPSTRSWAQALLKAVNAAFNAISLMPFNRGEELSVSDSGTADTEFSVTHHLGRAPEGFLITNIDAGGVVYDSGTTWTNDTIYLKCSAANAAITLRVF